MRPPQGPPLTLDERTVSPSAYQAEPVDRTRTTGELTQEWGVLRSRSRNLRESSDELHDNATTHHRTASLRHLTARAATRARLGVPELLALLESLGFSWRDIARCVGVTVPAVRKWRRGESASGGNRLRLAEFVALCDLLGGEHHVVDVAGWFEVPVLPGIPVTPLDLYESRRTDLVLDHAANHVADPSRILDEFDPDWRSRYHSDYEVFLAEDGQPSLRVRDDGTHGASA